MRTILVIAEAEHGKLTLPTLECIAEARDLADGTDASVHALLAGHELSELAEELAAHGADSVRLIEHELLAHYSADAWLAALEPVVAGAIGASGVHLLLAPDSGHVRDWLPRLAVRLRVPLISGCLQVHLSTRRGFDGSANIEYIRPTFGGARHDHLTCPGAQTVFATLTPSARGIGHTYPGRHATVAHIKPQLDPAHLRDRALRTIPPDPRTVDLTEAERIVSGGLGIGGPQGVDTLWKLADKLGATVGGTRVIADRGWIPYDRFIGTTGKIVSPRLYFGLGVSGASQHTSGMNTSETVIVINSDRTAPLFSLADLGIIGDFNELLPELLKRLDNLSSNGNDRQ